MLYNANKSKAFCGTSTSTSRFHMNRREDHYRDVVTSKCINSSEWKKVIQVPAYETAKPIITPRFIWLLISFKSRDCTLTLTRAARKSLAVQLSAVSAIFTRAFSLISRVSRHNRAASVAFEASNRVDRYDLIARCEGIDSQRELLSYSDRSWYYRGKEIPRIFHRQTRRYILTLVLSSNISRLRNAIKIDKRWRYFKDARDELIISQLTKRHIRARPRTHHYAPRGNEQH